MNKAFFLLKEYLYFLILINSSIRLARAKIPPLTAQIAMFPIHSPTINNIKLTNKNTTLILLIPINNKSFIKPFSFLLSNDKGNATIKNSKIKPIKIVAVIIKVG